MTASLLLFYICAALILQLVVGVGIAVFRLRQDALGTGFAPDDERTPAVPGAWSGWRQFRVARRNFEDAGCTQCSFHLMPVDGEALLPFKPGQFLTVRLQAPNAVAGMPDQGRMIARCYSLSDRPLPAEYRITIKRVLAPPDRPGAPPGIASAYFHDSVQDNDVIEIRAPAGQFFLDPDPLVPVVLICGGIGITPMMSIVRLCLDEQPDRVLHLFHGVRNGRERAFKSALEQRAGSHPNFHLNLAYSRPDPDDVHGRDFQHAGHIDIDLLKEILPRGRRHFYVCGPPPMMESLVPALRVWGIPDADIHFESFGPASVQSAAGVSPGAVLAPSAQWDVAFRRSGRTLRWDGCDASLLDFAERHGIAVDSGCRSGSCGACETKLVSGMVRYVQKPGYDISSGCCLLCVGVPASALLLDA
jgi:ferredoxin-NADP reductase